MPLVGIRRETVSPEQLHKEQHKYQQQQYPQQQQQNC
jgi:hypothetical protein